MAKVTTALLAWNRGVVSKLALARVDLERMRLSAETQTNWIPRVVGAMKLRPGLGYIANTRSNAFATQIPFIYSVDAASVIEMTALKLRIMSDDAFIERASVATTITNGDFGAAGSWTLTTTGSGTAAISGGVLTIAGVSTGGRAVAQQTVSVSATNANTEHAVRIEITRGPVAFKIGTTAGDEDLFAEEQLDTGSHSIAFTPGGTTFVVHIETTEETQKIVDSITVEASGKLELTTPWPEAVLQELQFIQSGNTLYVVHPDYQQRKIKWWGGNSWSIFHYKPSDGPFYAGRTAEVTLTPSATSGNVTLTADRDFFKATNVGSLFRLFHTGQVVNASLSAENTFSTAIRVTGVTRLLNDRGEITASQRSWQYTITGTWVGTITLQRSFDSDTTGFTDVSTTTSNTTATVNDGLENQIVWYRLGFKTGNYTSGTAVIQVTYGSGGGAGIARVTGYTSRTVVDAEVLVDFKNTTATEDWNEGQWSDRRIWPSSITLFDGRLWQMGGDRIWGSISDSYDSHDIEMEGDAGPINRSIGTGPIARVNFALALNRLIVGTDAAEHSIRSSNFDSPLTPTDFSIRDISTQGSAAVPAVKVDARGVFVQRSGKRVYELAYSFENQEYATRDLTELVPDMCESGVRKILVQRQPDTRIHFILNDGTVACLLFEPSSEVLAWYKIETQGIIEDGCVLPGTDEDRVYYTVQRVIGGTTARFHEKFALESEAVGDDINKMADCFVHRSVDQATHVSGFEHLGGQECIAWADGVHIDDVTPVSGSGIAQVSEPVDELVIGLPYEAEFKSAKLAYGAMSGTALNQTKRISGAGFILADTHARAIRFGQFDDELDYMPEIEDDDDVDEDAIHDHYDEGIIEFPGDWDSDARFIMKASAPLPATVLAAVLRITTHEKT